MQKILFEHFEKMMSFDVAAHSACIEVEFRVDDSPVYNACWLGKTFDRMTRQAVYWYGLVPDGSQAYDCDSLHEFVDMPVFNGKSIKDIWDSIAIFSIDNCDVDSRLAQYIGSAPMHVMGSAGFCSRPKL